LNSVNISGTTLTITDPSTGEKHSIERDHLRALVSEAAAHCPDAAFAEVPQELRDLLADGGPVALEGVKPQVIEPQKPQVLEVQTAPRRGGLIPMNRAQRRAEEKRRRRARKAQQKAIPKEVRDAYQAALKQRAEQEALQDVPFADPRNVGKIVKGFEPIVKAIQSLKDGVVACMPDGTPLYFEAEDGVYYPAVDCIRAVTETFAKLGHVHDWPNHNHGLSHLANLLEKDAPIHQKDIDAAMKTIEWMKYCMLTVTPRQFAREVVEVQIKAELKDQGLAA
jgi:hypothetical protein